MAIFRIYRKEWEKDQRPMKTNKKGHATRTSTRKTLNNDSEEGLEGEEDEDEPEGKQHPGGGRKGVSSGLSVIVKRKGESGGKSQRRPRPSLGTKAGWWKQLG
jgi:RNA exonuclease 4